MVQVDQVDEEPVVEETAIEEVDEAELERLRNLKSYVDRVTPHTTTDVRWIADLKRGGLPNDRVLPPLSPIPLSTTHTLYFSACRKLHRGSLLALLLVRLTAF